MGLHVGEGGRAGGDLVPAEQPHQGGDKSGPGDGLSPAEEAVADALEQAQLRGAGHALLGPVTGWDVAVAGGGSLGWSGGEEQAQGQKQR